MALALSCPRDAHRHAKATSAIGSRLPSDLSSAALWRQSAAVPQLLPPLADDAVPSDAEMALALDRLPLLCWVARADGYITWYNRRWHDYCGTTPAAMQGWGWQDVHDPAQLDRVLAEWQQSVDTGKAFEMIFPLRGGDGLFLPFLTRAVPITDASGAIVRWYGVNTEISRQERAEADLSSSEARYTVLTEAMPQMVWSTLPDGNHDYFNARWYSYTGTPIGSTDGEGWAAVFHPDDMAAVWPVWQRCLATGDPYEVEYRLRHHSGDYRWVLGRALPVRDKDGRIIRWIGTCTDVHAARLAAENNEILSRELSHRIKNIFAVIAGLIGLSARREPDHAPFAQKLTDRVLALGRAHEFARPHSDESRPMVGDASIVGMLDDLMAPYQGDAAPRVRIHGPALPVDDQAATPLALAFHELATNSAKYGALSSDRGTVDLDISVEDGTVLMRWTEQGGPPITSTPTRTGFGTQLANLSIERQLGGEIRREWLPDGLALLLTIPAGRLSR